MKVAPVEKDLVISHIGGEEDIGEAIVVEVADGYAASVVEVAEQEAVVELLVHNFIVEIDAGIVHELEERIMVFPAAG